MGEILCAGRGRELILSLNLGEVWSLFFPVHVEVGPALTRVYWCNILKMH